jgi:hypothetical protein
MPRTTVNIDLPVLRELRRLKEQERKPLGRLISDLLAEALGRRRSERPHAAPRLRWTSHSMGALVDLDDKERLWKALEGQADKPQRTPRRRKPRATTRSPRPGSPPADKGTVP